MRQEAADVHSCCALFHCPYIMYTTAGAAVLLSVYVVALLHRHSNPTDLQKNIGTQSHIV